MTLRLLFVCVALFTLIDAKCEDLQRDVEGCFCLTALEDNSKVRLAKLDEENELKGCDIYYNINGKGWIQIKYANDENILLNKGDKVYFCASDYKINKTNFKRDDNAYLHFVMESGKWEASGDLTTLICRGGNITDLTIKDGDSRFAFNCLFLNCTNLVSAKNLRLTSTTLSNSCYCSMFEGCENLLDAPELNADKLENHCYRRMFFGCSKLNTVKVGRNSDNIYNDVFFTDWLKGATAGGIIICPAEVQNEFSKAVVPVGWCINGLDVSVSTAGFATAYIPFTAKLSDESVKVYYISMAGEKLTLSDANVIPAGTGVLLKGNAGNTVSARFIPSEDVVDVHENLLLGSAVEKTFNDEGYKFYRLTNGEKGIGFYWDVTEQTDGRSVKCNAGKAILRVPESAGVKSFFAFDTETTDLYEISRDGIVTEPLVNMQGLRVGSEYRGIVISNGKKMLRK